MERTQLSRRVRESVVWIENGKVYKSQPKFLTDNEYYFLSAMRNSGYVPVNVVREGVELISMEYIESELVTDATAFWQHFHPVLQAMVDRNIKHGDLTEYSVLVRNNKPVIIDWAEARIGTSPIELKRPRGDSYWLRRTMRKLTGLPIDE